MPDTASSQHEARTSQSGADATYHIAFTDKQLVAPTHTPLVWSNAHTKVFDIDGRECRCHYVSGEHAPYCISTEESAWQTTISYRRTHIDLLQNETVFASALAMERPFGQWGFLLLHCSFLVCHGQAVLLSGPSGIGKTTQAELWTSCHDDSHIVNGDRCIIGKNQQGEFTAYGWPVCGSSGVCLNEHYPIKAIVMLEQSSKDQMLAETPMNHFKRLYSQITVNHWNGALAKKCVATMTELLQKVPFYVYGCTPTVSATQKLYNTLFPETPHAPDV